MKKLLMLMMIAVALNACQIGSRQYKISGTLKGAGSGTVFLIKAPEGKPVTVDSISLVKDEFTFKGTVSIPEMYYLRLGEREYFAQFFIENSKINIVANKDSLNKTTVTGSKTNDILKLYLDEIERLNKEYGKIRESMMYGDEQTIKKAKIDAEAMMDNMNVYAKNFISEHRASVVAPFIYLSQFINQSTVEELDTIVNIFPEEIAESIYVKEIKRIAELKKKTAIGAIAPEFTMNDPNGQPVSLSSFKGKYLMIDFWASWCAPCRQENPNVVRIYNKFHDKGFEILGVSLDRDKESWLRGIEEDKLTWGHVSDLKYWQNEVAKLYGVQSIPFTVLLDKEGKIIATNLRGETLEAKLTELLGN